jgi:hypothetical protein
MVMLKKQLKYIQQVVKDTFNVITCIKSLSLETYACRISVEAHCKMAYIPLNTYKCTVSVNP